MIVFSYWLVNHQWWCYLMIVSGGMDWGASINEDKIQSEAFSEGRIMGGFALIWIFLKHRAWFLRTLSTFNTINLQRKGSDWLISNLFPQKPAKESFLAVLPTLVHGGGEELDVEEVVAAQRALNLLNHTPAMFHFVIIYLLSSLDSYQHNCFHTLNKNWEGSKGLDVL